MNFLTIDFETYYDKDFSLSKLTTEEYVRDDRFEVIGVSVKVGDEPAQWFSGTKGETKDWLDQFEMEKYFVVAHNMMFDGAILAWYFDTHPFALMDTLAMLRAVDGTEVGNSLAKAAERYGIGKKGTEVVAAMGKRRRDFSTTDLQQYGEYCKNDVEITYKLFEILRYSFKNKELRLIDLTLRMFTKPALQLNLPLLEQHLIDVVDKKEALIAAASADKDSLMSNLKFADMLIDLGVEPPTKISPTTGKLTFAFAKNDDGFKALADHPDLQVQALVAARLGNKSTLEETRTQRFIDIAKRGSLPVPLRYYAAHTGRWGGDDKLNLQNLPRGKKGEPPPKLKCAIVPPEGYVLIDSDSSQIEARVLAWLAGQNDLVNAFESGEDVYRIMAAKIYRRQIIANVTEEERFVGKTTILGCGYGMGHVKFRAQLRAFGVDLSEEWCKKVLRTYRDEYSHIPASMGRGACMLGCPSG
jgi:DNA polymerase I-like protein with 3'-5' exonuclease and polymerase domains